MSAGDTYRRTWSTLRARNRAGLMRADDRHASDDRAAMRVATELLVGCGARSLQAVRSALPCARGHGSPAAMKGLRCRRSRDHAVAATAGGIGPSRSCSGPMPTATRSGSRVAFGGRNRLGSAEDRRPFEVPRRRGSAFRDLASSPSYPASGRRGVDAVRAASRRCRYARASVRRGCPARAQLSKRVCPRRRSSMGRSRCSGCWARWGQCWRGQRRQLMPIGVARPGSPS